MASVVFKLPDLGEGVVEGEIVEWHVRPGDAVGEDEPVVDVMTDKATVTIPAKMLGKRSFVMTKKRASGSSSWFVKT